MKMCLIPAVTAKGAWLTAGRSAAGAVLLAVTVSACTGGGSATSVPSIFTPSVPTNGHSSTDAGTRTPSPTGQASRSSGGSSASATSTARGGASSSGSANASSSAHASSSPLASSSAHASSSATARASQAPTAQVTTEFPSTAAPTHSSAPQDTAIPTAAPETGGGGSAGLQDGVLFGGGGLAVLAGIGTLAYRRRLSRKFAARRDARDSASAGPEPRDPANR